jgi:Icc protein
MKFIHITDTHLISPGSKLHSYDPAKRLALCLDDIKRQQSDAECCVITGDLADRGEDAAYQFLLSEINQLDFKCHLILGNHDNRKIFLRCFPDTKFDENGFIQYTVQTSAGVFIIIDTLESGNHGGIYCDNRHAWLQATLESYKAEPVFLFMHHPPFDLSFPCIDDIGLADQKTFAKLVQPYNNIRHLFFGHAHRPISGNWMGISFSTMRGTNHQVKLDFNSNQINIVDERPEYSVVFISDDRVVVHSHAFPLEFESN